MFLQVTTAETFDFMLYGFALILGTIAIFVASLIVRYRNLARELQVLEQIEAEK